MTHRLISSLPMSLLVAASDSKREAETDSAITGSGTTAFTSTKAATSWFVRAECEVFEKIGDLFNSNGTQGTTRADVKMRSVGVGYRF